MQAKKRTFLVACLIIFMMIMMGCGAQFARDQYRSLAIAQGAYNLSWGRFKKIYDDKVKDSDGNLIISDVDYAKGLDLATKYYDAWIAWIDLVMLYERMKESNADLVEATKLTVQQKVALFSDMSLKFLNFVEPFIKKGGVTS